MFKSSSPDARLTPGAGGPVPRGPRRRGAAFAALSAAILALSALTPAEARAGLSIGAEAGPSILVGGTPNNGSTGFGFAGRLGYALPIPLLKLTPELKVAYDHLPVTFGAPNVDSIRAMAGARVTIGALLSPIAFAHVGYGHLSSPSDSGLAYDLGAGLDFTLLPFIDLGVFASFNRLAINGSNIDWLMAGAQAAISF